MIFGIPGKLVVSGSLVLLLAVSFTFGARRMQRLSNGVWGGKHIQFEVVDGSVSIEYDCAHGSIAGPLTFDRQGRFSWHGTYTREHGGPIRIDERVNNQPAIYSGSINGDTMTLTMRLEDSSIEPQTYTLTRDNVGRVWKCK